MFSGEQQPRWFRTRRLVSLVNKLYRLFILSKVNKLSCVQWNAEVLTGKWEECGKAQKYLLVPKINSGRRDMVRIQRSLLYLNVRMMEICNKIQTLLHVPTLLGLFCSFLRSKNFEYSWGVAVTGPTIVMWLTKEIRLFCCTFSPSLVFCFHGYLGFRKRDNVEVAFPNVWIYQKIPLELDSWFLLFKESAFVASIPYY